MRVVGALLAAMVLSSSGPAWPQPAPASLPPPVTPACISSPFGPRKLPGPHAAAFHNGIDLPAPDGAWVHAVAAGEVVAIRHRPGYGLEIDLSHHDADGGRFLTRYAHLGSVSPALQTGRRVVKLGEPIARIGRSGIIYGTHLYFEMQLAGAPVDPEPFFAVPRCGHRGGTP
jgi:murein DD-endopeptidase MepM/ murein hydrolase activator NlpD